MATIEFGTSQNPYAYGDIGRADFDREWRSTLTVYVDARVENTGNASGSATLYLYDLDKGGPEDNVGHIQSNTQTVQGLQDDIGGGGTPGVVTLHVEQLMAQDAYVDFYAEVLDSGRNLLASRQFSVNAYDQPRVAILSSGSIQVSVR